jgi:hypothetical protein
VRRAIAVSRGEKAGKRFGKKLNTLRNAAAKKEERIADRESLLFALSDFD